MSSLEGRAAIVTGGASGIGEATAQKLAQKGAQVVVADINSDGGDRVVEIIKERGGSAYFRRTDVREEGDVRELVAFTAEACGTVDILHNNAADLSVTTMSRDADVADVEPDLWDHVMAVNLRGQMLCCKYVIPVMVDHGGGSIINMSSGSGMRGDFGLSAYSASKAGIDSLTRSVAAQYGKRNVRCNALAPGMVLTPAGKTLIPEPALTILEQNHLTPRVGYPEDIANVVAFLASPEACFITGQVISIDGGILSHMPTMAQMRELRSS